jgi:glycosyltransferase involved in cell wall biosynthesis
MYKKLIVITTKFPYFNTEAFLESEYHFLQKAFDEVTFLPLIKGICREQCQNATICDAYANLYSHKLPFMYKVVSSKNYYSSLWKHRTKIFEKHRIANTFKQEVHYQIFKKLVSANFSLFDDKTIVYSYWFNAPVYALLKLKEELGLKYKVVCRAHRYDVYDENGEMPNRAYCIRTINKVFPISQDAINYFTNKYGHPEKYVLSRLGVKDFGCIAQPSESNSFHVLSVSQVHPRKRIREIYESVIEFSIRHPEKIITWTHFGDGKQLNDFMLWATSHNVPNLTIEVKGRVANTDILNYIGETPLDVFINLSVSEGVPVSIMEAQSFGLPVIATDVGGTREVMTNTNGILLSSYPTIAEVADAMDQIFYNQFNRKVIKESWKKISDADLNYSTFVKQLSILT